MNFNLKLYRVPSSCISFRAVFYRKPFRSNSIRGLFPIGHHFTTPLTPPSSTPAHPSHNIFQICALTTPPVLPSPCFRPTFPVPPSSYQFVCVVHPSRYPRLRDLRFRTWGLEINHLNAHNFVRQGLFHFHYNRATSMTDWAQISTQVCYFMHMLRYTNCEG